MTARLIVQNLWVRYPTPARVIEAVRGVSFTLGREKLGIVGESGSGKSTVGRAILRLVPPPGEVSAERLIFDGIHLLSADQATLRAVRGRRITMVMQDPKFSLNPVMTVGRQIREAYRAHSRGSRGEARRRAREASFVPPGPGELPDRAALVRDEVARALDSLAPGERRAVVLRHLHDLGYDEIGAVLGISAAAAISS